MSQLGGIAATQLSVFTYRAGSKIEQPWGDQILSFGSWVLYLGDALRVLTPPGLGVLRRGKLGDFSPLPVEMKVILLSDFCLFGLVFFLSKPGGSPAAFKVCFIPF